MTAKTVKLTDRNDIPVLQGWMTLTEAGLRLGYSRQYVHKMAQKNVFKSLHRIGDSATHVVSSEEVSELLHKRIEKEIEETS